MSCTLHNRCVVLQIVGDGVLNLSHLQGAFILLLLGLGVAFFVLVLECAV